ncbi:MAG: 4-hydroxythreonine-4-phosphate dehydrogenase PdxA [Candidatus Binatus sp.]|uniref:4-hydroxythreonine-4-phosphate dehydrogenase PdxA n=1 Tax=Candidatus Binatus sp. TaxID=2811406 RepID=UPI002720401A|nr:4-hydroxythreonine-4-phosphate dehydrogenase PdxA [Candidatus Binatus sp.]MDO8434318.1 4-hydroxythreonine-4-phosphate dehydrogenase PdxA [Candidatus Binatus sp.]
MAASKKSTPTIAISMGDPAGIGPEVILKAIVAIGRRRSAPSIIVIGDLRAMQAAAARLKNVATPREWHRGESIPAPTKHVAVCATSKLSERAMRPGHPTVEGGGAAYDYIVRGARMALDGEVDALVTAPISKEWMNRAGHRFPGHSELLAQLSRTKLWRMTFAGGDLTLALVTTHMGLAKVASALTQRKILDTVNLLAAHLRTKFAIANPRIAVLGFNPHAGENGLFGDEEIRVIAPAIRRARREGIDAFGPLAPDTAFIRPDGKFGFDAAVAMYHDQGLIALKTLEFDRAVNVTLGLPFVRTSPDHGTAFDIAGKGVANPSSMIAAIDYASRAAAGREGANKRVAA